MVEKDIDLEKLDSIIAVYKDEKWGLIPLLQEVQRVFGYIPPECIARIARGMGLFPSQVQGVATFYAGFSLKPKGKHVIKVCRGTACHVKGGRSVLRVMRKETGLDEGETGEDYQFTLETAACLGACFLAPTMLVDQTYFGRLSPTRVVSVLNQYRSPHEEKTDET